MKAESAAAGETAICPVGRDHRDHRDHRDRELDGGAMKERMEAETCAEVVAAEMKRRHGRGRVRARRVFVGLGATAAELECSRYHLAAVLRGRRKPGAELAAKLKAAGIKTAKLRKRGEQWV